MKLRGFTKAEVEAIEYLGSHRKSDVKVGVGKPISARTFNSLKRKNAVMWMSEARKIAMLTYGGELLWTKLHPASKYKIR